MKCYVFRAMLLMCGICVLWFQPTHAAPSLETYGRLPAVDKMAISPSGELLAFRRTSADHDLVVLFSMKKSKYIASIDVSAIDPNHLIFYSDNYLILRASKHKKLHNYRHAMDLSTAFSYDIKNNKVKPLIRLGESLGRERSIYLGQTGAGRILGASPDGKYLYMPAYVAENSSDDSPNYSLLRVKIDGSGQPKVVSKGNNYIIDYYLNDRGEVIAREYFNEKSNIHKIQVKQGKKWRTLLEVNTEIIAHHFVGLTPDFQHLVFIKREDKAEHNAYFTMRLTDGSINRLPYSRQDADIEGAIHNGNRVIFGLEYSGFTPRYQFFEPEKQQRIASILKHFPEHSVHLQDWSANWQSVVVKVEGSQHPGSYFIFPSQGGYSKIASAYEGINPEDLNPIGKLTYTARDGTKIPTLLTIPIDKLDAIKNLPAVILPHGGPASYDTIHFDFIAQALASKGILVIQPQFRGSSGFGYQHRVAGYGEWGKKMQDDLTDAVAFFARKGYINKQKVCIAGASYGGYAALAGAAFTPDIYQCAVSIAGVSHLPKMLQSDKSRYGKDSPVMAYFAAAIGGGELDNKMLRQISPYYHAEKIKIPVLLIHGVDDTIVEYNQSRMMHSAIKKAQGKSKLVKLKREDHYLQDGETRLQALREVIGFITRHLGDSSQS